MDKEVLIALIDDSGQRPELWVIEDDRVQRIVWWTEAGHYRNLIIAKPSSAGASTFYTLNQTAFRTERSALQENQERLDGMRRYYDVMAEANLKRIAELERKNEFLRAGGKEGFVKNDERG